MTELQKLGEAYKQALDRHMPATPIHFDEIKEMSSKRKGFLYICKRITHSQRVARLAVLAAGLALVILTPIALSMRSQAEIVGPAAQEEMSFFVKNLFAKKGEAFQSYIVTPAAHDKRPPINSELWLSSSFSD